MNTYYLSADSFDSLAGMLVTLIGLRPVMKYENILGPLQGIAATQDTTDANGNVIPGNPGAGDPNKWYLSIRTDDTVTLPSGVVEDETNGIAVLGLWA